MAVRGTADGKPMRWTFSSRFVKDIPQERARIRNTLMYTVTPSFQAGIEYNPLKERVGLSPLANWRVVAESGWRPALIVGTSSDRIGTPHGQSFYATASRNLESMTGIPVAPYAGVAYGTYEGKLDPIGGGNIFWTDRVSTTHLYDGKTVHHMLNVGVTDRLSAGILYVTQKDDPGDPYWGLTWGFRF